MKTVTIDVNKNPKAKAFAEKITLHKKRKMEELHQIGLIFKEKVKSGEIVFPQS